MTTITALNVRLGMDVSNFSQGANLAKAEVTKVASIMRQSVPAADKYKQELDLLNRSFSDVGKKSKQYADAIQFLKQKYDATTPAIKAANAATRETISATDGAMAAVKRLAAAYLGIQTVTKSIRLATEIEDATVAFEVLTGSARDGALLFRQVREFAERSPITFSGGIQATRTMMSFGVAAEDVLKNLKMLSDVTGGNNERFKMLSLAFSQTSAAGRLMGQDLLQMINAGFNPLQQISKMTGESMVDLKKRMEDGGISANEVRGAFEAATAEGGMFHGMTERLAETMGGKLNIAFSQLEKSLAAVGEAIAPLIILMTDGFEKGQGTLNLIVKTIEKIADGLGYILALASDIYHLSGNTEIDKFLDMIEARDRGRAAAAEANNGELQFQTERQQAAAAAAAVDRKAMEEAEKARLKAIANAEKARLKAIEAERKAQQKAIDDEMRARMEAARAWQRELEAARNEAMKFFDDRERQRKQIRADVSKGPGAGAEIGSSEYVKFFADQINRRIGAAAVPNAREVREIDIAKKTAELLLAQRDANIKQQRQIDIADAMLRELQENGFRRLR